MRFGVPNTMVVLVSQYIYSVRKYWQKTVIYAQKQVYTTNFWPFDPQTPLNINLGA